MPNSPKGTTTTPAAQKVEGEGTMDPAAKAKETRGNKRRFRRIRKVVEAGVTTLTEECQAFIAELIHRRKCDPDATGIDKFVHKLGTQITNRTQALTYRMVEWHLKRKNFELVEKIPGEKLAYMNRDSGDVWLWRSPSAEEPNDKK
ncbi:Uu.00g078460.m01.CDS01 [Anthostomella pinea]|uniref:Uu.00g078460.m01.CDS01 n=1 Tax=Anthostomella pinea TaxID=933095 RepID=A0AAI8YJ47_9PEZI|nr:Uu.00g078460.m01.CDS01 [Anthostomella pinea]